MSTKVALYKLDTEYSCDEIAKLMLENQYSDNVSHGFIVSKSNGKIVSGKHVLKKTKMFSSEDPFGNIKTYEEDSYTINEFVINEGKTKSIEIHNPARILSSFRTDLGQSLNFQCSIVEHNINLEELIYSLNDKTENLSILSMEIDSIHPFPNSVAKMRIKGSGDLIHSVNTFLNNEDYSFDKAGLSFNLNNEKVLIDISKRGAIYYKDENTTKTTKKEIISLLLNQNNLGHE